MTDTDGLTEPFRQHTQQRDARIMGMYIFVATEIMLFGGIFAIIFAVGLLHSSETVQVSKALDLWIGAVNTAVLLTSSFAIEIAGPAGAHDRRKLLFLPEYWGQAS